MNVQDDLPDESDTSDEDYDPGTKEDEVSEVESDGDDEEPLSDNEDLKRKFKKAKRKKPKSKTISQNTVSECKENKIQVEDDKEKKKKEDDLWADFMKDTGFVSKTNPKSISNCTTNRHNADYIKKSTVLEKTTPKKYTDKIKIKQIFEFAGEEVEVEKEVPSNSLEAAFLSNASHDVKPCKRAAGLGGIGNVLSQLTKKPKISTLEKTKLDWDRFKKEENLEEELSTHNKGKDGFLERQEFLERADLRRFEIEKELRTIERNKRFNSTS